MLTIRRNGKEREREREGEREKRGVGGVSDHCTKYAIGTGGWLCRYVMYTSVIVPLTGRSSLYLYCK